MVGRRARQIMCFGDTPYPAVTGKNRKNGPPYFLIRM